MQLRVGFFLFCLAFLGSLGAGCASSSMRVSDSSLGVQGAGNVVAVARVPFTDPAMSVAARRAVLMSPTGAIPTKKYLSAIWGPADAVWADIDSPVSAHLQLRFKCYHALLKIVNATEKRGKLLQALRHKVSVIAVSCSEQDLRVLEAVSRLLGDIEVASSEGFFHDSAKVAALRLEIQLQIDNADTAYSLRLRSGHLFKERSHDEA